ncbi:MAG: alpha-E domain-containing protein [Chitinophagaceae bacterium]|nr:alpha-E domain-containing protein [Chitinophagaceae bacterium]
MLSRIADSLFWVTRYMERTDSLLRVVRTNYILSFDVGNSGTYSWKDILSTFTSMDDETIKLNGENTAAALEYLIADPKNINAVRVLIVRARENARGVQDNITKEVWEQVNQLYHLINQPDLAKKLKGSKAIEILDLLTQNSLLFYGVTDSSMPRGQGWNFMNLGKYIERALLTIEIINSHFRKTNYELSNSQDILYWRNLLLSLSGYELYLKAYTSGKHSMNIVDHVIANKNFPRSIFYSIDRIKRYFDQVILDTQIEGCEGLQKQFGRLHSNVKFADFSNNSPEQLQQFLNTTRNDLVEFSKQLTHIYFSYA